MTEFSKQMKRLRKAFSAEGREKRYKPNFAKTPKESAIEPFLVDKPDEEKLANLHEYLGDSVVNSEQVTEFAEVDDNMTMDAEYLDDDTLQQLENLKSSLRELNVQSKDLPDDISILGTIPQVLLSCFTTLTAVTV